MAKQSPKYKCTHPNCECPSTDKKDCLAERRNRNEAIIQMKKTANGENDF